MNQQAYESGKRAYQNSDWLTSVSYLSQAKRPGEISGEVDHLLGNAYMNLGRYDSAADAYASALRDTSYGKRGALSCNRGRALLAAGRTQEAIAALKTASQDPSYATPYKAYMALGAAYESQGDTLNAAIAYRSAALDEGNPAPANALCKLGKCFMGLGRAVDAVETYRTALDYTEPYDDRQNEIWSELGCAYVSLNRMSEAVDAFAHATADGTYTLSPEAQASYSAARKAQASIASRQPSDTDEFLRAAGYGPNLDPLDPLGESGELMPSPEDTGFFTISEQDLIEQDKAAKKSRRKHRHTGLKVFIVILIIVVILVLLACFAYYEGYGYPTQEMVVEELFAAKTAGEDISEYVSESVTDTQIEEMEDSLPDDATIEVTGCDQDATSSTVYLTASLSDGGELDYTVYMTRDGISWKVTSLTTSYLSQDDSEIVSTDDETEETDTSESESTEETDSTEETTESESTETETETTEADETSEADTSTETDTTTSAE